MTSDSNTSSVSSIVSLAIELHQCGHIDEAEELYCNALRQSPNNIDAQHFLGVLRHSKGDSKDAIRLIRSVLRQKPGYVDAHVNLGNVLKESDKISEAEKQYREALRIAPQNPQALNNLGVVLRLQKRNEEAIDAFQSAIESQPKFADAYVNLGNALDADGRSEDALTAYRKAVDISPNHTTSHRLLGATLAAFGRMEEASLVYRKWLEVDPGNAVAEHMLAACAGGKAPPRCSDEFVRKTFDGFAASFDQVLQDLQYRAPQLIGESIKEALPAPTAAQRVLDAGCGTGLCGELVRPYAAELVGIDLSPNMLAKARTRGCYDVLETAELSTYMTAHPSEFDLIISADTLVYFGELQEVLAAIASALRSSGVVVFSLEQAGNDVAVDGVKLNSHGRYSHTEDYVTNGLLQAGLSIHSVKHDVLRSEAQKPVGGLVFTAVKLAPTKQGTP